MGPEAPGEVGLGTGHTPRHMSKVSLYTHPRDRTPRALGLIPRVSLIGLAWRGLLGSGC